MDLSITNTDEDFQNVSFAKEVTISIDTNKSNTQISNIDTFITEIKNTVLFLHSNKYNMSYNYFLDFFNNFTKILSCILEITDDMKDYMKKLKEGGKKMSKEYLNKMTKTVNKFNTQINNMNNDFKFWISYYDNKKNSDISYNNIKHKFIFFKWDNKEEHRILFLRNKFQEHIHNEKLPIPNKIMKILKNNNDPNFQNSFCIIKNGTIYKTNVTTLTFEGDQEQMMNKIWNCWTSWFLCNSDDDYQPNNNLQQQKNAKWDCKFTFNVYEKKLKSLNKEFNELDNQLNKKLKEILSFLQNIKNKLIIKNINDIASITESQKFSQKLKDELNTMNSSIRLIIQKKNTDDIKQYFIDDKIPNNWSFYNHNSKNAGLLNDRSGTSYVWCSFLFIKIIKTFMIPIVIIFLPLYYSYKYFTLPEKSIKQSILGIAWCIIGTALPIGLVYGSIYYIKHLKKKKN